MKKMLDTVQKKEKLNVVLATDEVGNGGAHHKYLVVADKHLAQPKEFEINFQKGPRNEEGSTHGVLDQDLLEIVKDRLTGFQEGPFASEYNAKALYHLNKALEAMNQRVEDRIKRNVLGTYKK